MFMSSSTSSSFSVQRLPAGFYGFHGKLTYSRNTDRVFSGFLLHHKTSLRARIHHRRRCTDLEKSSSISSVSSPSENYCNNDKGRNSDWPRNTVIRRVFNPYDFDPFKLKKDKALFDEQEVKMLEILESFEYKHAFDDGPLVVKFMNSEYMSSTEDLLTESFVDLMWGPLTYRPILKLSVRENMLDRRSIIPHSATLVALHAPNQGDWVLVGTVELSFNAKGSSPLMPTPIPPKDAPYLCNMAVDKKFRRRGIGKHLLMASEKLVQEMGSNEMYLHCRIIDLVPFGMYTKAGYNVVQTDNIFALLTLQRRRHLLYKKFHMSM
eukprot:TRINITY_DN18549_c0_g1_i2.p1 TRINITY_DN18549_c0_g1~~TRINITY_DN18549_c0_g1_i2.p1  ORF type:complete len:322 (+),score=53.08 TRINITY_DN18549_c0_g1_i2:296-1261(+)